MRGQAAFSRGCSTRRRGTFAPLPPARHGLAIAAVRAMLLALRLSDAGRLASERLEPIARAPSSCPSRPRPQRASAARQRPTHGATSAERSWGRAFRATRGARSEVMIGGGVRATRGARSEVGPSSSRRDPGPGCVCAPLAACRTLPLPARLRLKRPSDARSAERGEGVRATRGARSEVGSCLAPRSRPWLRTGFLPYTLPLLARVRLTRPSDARSAERGEGVRATRGARSEVGPASRRDAGPGCVCAAGFLPYAATAGPAAFEAPERRARSEVSRGARPSKAQSARAPSEAPMPEHGRARVVFSGYIVLRVWSCALCLVSGEQEGRPSLGNGNRA